MKLAPGGGDQPLDADPEDEAQLHEGSVHTVPQANGGVMVEMSHKISKHTENFFFARR